MSYAEDITDAWIDTHLADDERITDRLLWSRSLMLENPAPAAPPGLSTIFCGHTPQKAVKHTYGHINLDTGCYIPYRSERPAGGSAGLTLMEVQTGRTWFFDGDRLLWEDV